MPDLERRWRAEDLRGLPTDGNRYEVVDGELLVTPAPSWRHQEAVGSMYALLREYLARQRIGTALVAPADVVFSPARAVQPDVFVVPLNDGRRAECFADVGRLLVAIEVLSATSARADRVAKRMMYRDVGVGEYWIVDLDARTVERSTPHEARPEILVEQLGWSPEGADDPFRVDLTAYFAAILDS